MTMICEDCYGEVYPSDNCHGYNGNVWHEECIMKPDRPIEGQGTSGDTLCHIAGSLESDGWTVVREFIGPPKGDADDPDSYLYRITATRGNESVVLSE